MILNVSNESNTDVYLHIDQKKYLIKASDRNVHIDNANTHGHIFVRRVQTISLPDRKNMILEEVLGIVAPLFIKPLPYTFDVSAEYCFLCDTGEIAQLKIVRIVHESNPNGIYDAVCIASSDLNLTHVLYRTENKTEILEMYNKCRRTAHLWLYILLESLFTLVGTAMICPILFIIYASTKVMLIKILLFLIPFLIIGGVALVGILPMHFLYKHHDKKFYHAMEHEEICSCIKN